jgi:hypothetical protein
MYVFLVQCSFNEWHNVNCTAVKIHVELFWIVTPRSDENYFITCICKKFLEELKDSYFPLSASVYIASLSGKVN